MVDRHQNGSGPGRQNATNLSWLLSTFVQQTAGVQEAVAVSADGFLLAGSADDDDNGEEQLAAVISGLTSLSRGAADLRGYGAARQLIIEMERGYFFVMSINDGSTFGVLADEGTDVGLVGYEMALLIDRVGAVLTPRLVEELKNSIQAHNR